MSFWLLLEKFHGHIGLLAMALCLHPPIALRRVRRPSWATRVAAYLATASVIAVNLLGWYIYPEYRNEVKLDLYRYARFWGLAFEVKEHLAWYSMATAFAASVMVWHSHDARGIALRRPISGLYLLTFVLVAITAVLGVMIASINGFDDAILPTGPR